MKVTVIEIYPNPERLKTIKKKNTLEIGTCHIHIEVQDFSMDIKNIIYILLEVANEKKVVLRMPSRQYLQEEEKITVSTVSFPKEVFTPISEEISKEVLENYKD